MTESLPPVIRDRILSRVGEATEHQVTADQRACSTLSGLAVHVYDVLGVLLQELHDEVAGLGQHNHRWGVVVLPVEVCDLVLEQRLVIHLSAHIVNPELVAVVLLNEPGHVLNWIPVAALQEIRGRIAHGVDARSDCRDVQVVVLIDISFSRSRHQ